jgi:hypothetical protein
MSRRFLAFALPHSVLARWLPDMDLNHDKQIQSLLCYRYTIGQRGDSKLDTPGGESRFVTPLSRRPAPPRAVSFNRRPWPGQQPD